METIIGSVVMANNSVVTAIGGDKIQSVTDEIRFDNLPLLTNLSFPMVSAQLGCGVELDARLYTGNRIGWPS